MPKTCTCRIVLIISIIFLSTGLISQNQKYNSTKDIRQSYLQNEQNIDRKFSQLRNLKEEQRAKENKKKDLYLNYKKAAKKSTDARDILTNAMLNETSESTVVLNSAIKKLRQEYLVKKADLDFIRQKINTIFYDIEALEEAQNKVEIGITKLENETNKLIGHAHYLNPPFITETLILRENPITYKQDTIYFKSLLPNDDYKLILSDIEKHLAAIKEFEEMIMISQRNVEIARKDFMDVHYKWSNKNIEYENQFSERFGDFEEFWIRVLLETGDVAIATQGGANVPALLFELGWRGRDLIIHRTRNEGFKYEIPKVSESYIKHIKALSEAVDGDPALKNAFGTHQNIVDNTIFNDSFKNESLENIGSEAIKSGFSLVASSYVESRAQKKMAESVGWWELIMSGDNMEDALIKYQNKGGTAFDDMSKLKDHLINISNGNKSYKDIFMNNIKSRKFRVDLFWDSAKSFGYTFAKDAINKWATQERFNIYDELAKIEIDWFVQRNAYNKAMWFREGQKKKLNELISKLGQQYVKLYTSCCKNESVYSPNLQIATSQIAEYRLLYLVLKFSQPMSELSVTLEGQSKIIKPSSKNYKNIVYKIALRSLFDDIENFKGGRVTLNVKGKSNKKIAIDGNPETPAFFNIVANEWSNYELRGLGDQSTILDFVKPEVSININSILPGPVNTSVNINFKSVNSFTKNASLMVYKSDKSMRHFGYKNNPNKILNNKTDGVETIELALEEGDYEIRLDDGFGYKAAKTSLKISKPFGEIHMKAFDKDDNETDYYVRVFEENDKKFIDGFSGTGLTKELLVGKYNLYFSVGLKDFERTINIEEGKTTLVEIHLKEENNKEPESTEKDAFLLPAPPKWATGTLYNSNDSNCSYGGEYLVFMSAGQRGNGRFLNRETAEFSQFVAVAPGDKLEVAVPADGIFIRVFSTKVLPDDLSTVPWSSISFGTMSNLVDGWWYQAGCKNGTRPRSRCDNGAGSGPSTSSSCSTSGED